MIFLPRTNPRRDDAAVQVKELWQMSPRERREFLKSMDGSVAGRRPAHEPGSRSTRPAATATTRRLDLSQLVILVIAVAAPVLLLAAMRSAAHRVTTTYEDQLRPPDPVQISPMVTSEGVRRHRRPIEIIREDVPPTRPHPSAAGKGPDPEPESVGETIAKERAMGEVPHTIDVIRHPPWPVDSFAA